MEYKNEQQQKSEEILNVNGWFVVGIVVLKVVFGVLYSIEQIQKIVL